MLDERWNEDVEEIAAALRRLLLAESSIERVRAAEKASDGRDHQLEHQLREFGLMQVQGGADLYARIAYELGRALAPTAFVESLPALAILGRGGIAYGFNRLVPAALEQVLIRNSDGVFVEKLSGNSSRSTAGDWLIDYQPQGHGERIGDAALADKLQRAAALMNAARLIGAGQSLLERGVAYAKDRQQFGKPIGGYQAVSHRLANCAIVLDAAELLLRKAAFTAMEGQGGDGAPSTPFAIMVSLKAIEASRFVATGVHQVFGGNGFSLEYDVQLFSRRIRSWASRAACAELGLAQLARIILTTPQRDSIRLLWHYDIGMPRPRWAAEADELGV